MNVIEITLSFRRWI